jgi:putative flippase GtrA
MGTTITKRIQGLVSLFWREVAKFGTVGGLKGRLVSATVATLFSWVANRYWTFRHRRQPNPVRELVMFIVINVIGMLISAACVWVARYPLEATSPTVLLFAGIFGTVLATAVRFFAYRFWVFNAELDAEPEFAQDHEIFEHAAESAPLPRRGAGAPQ